MSYHPYPSADRARSQVARHADETFPGRLAPAGVRLEVTVKWPTLPEGWNEAAATKAYAPIRAMLESMRRVRVSQPVLTFRP